MILTEILSTERVRVAARGTGVESKDDASMPWPSCSRRAPRHRGQPTSTACSPNAKRCNRRESATASPFPTGLSRTSAGSSRRSSSVPDGIPFDAIDGDPVYILFAVVGPKRATGEHLKTLARISRLLRDPSFREKLLGSADRAQAYSLIRSAEEGRAA